MPHLFDPLKLRSLQFRNRIFVSPMCEYSSEDGFANDWHFVHLGSRAIGGAALVLTEASAVSPDGRITPDDLGIYEDAHIAPLARIFKFISDHGAAPGMQLAHAGRKASRSAPWKGTAHGDVPLSPAKGGWQPIFAPSAIAFDSGYATPKEMSLADIECTISDFAAAARRAHAAGAKVIEIHAAHGYLLHSFLSPLSNHRKDKYGGSLENRTRIVREVLQAIRKVWPEDLPVFVRISASDWAEGGWDLDQSVELAIRLRELGADLIDCSSGGLVPNAKIAVGAGYQVEFAERIRKDAHIATGAVGMITSPQQADQIIRTGQADAVLLARELLRDPYWPHRAAFELHKPEFWPPQYDRARRGHK
jgi:2,4-dienoyl-CoA reductase-like NADH-dependent reductase (Old Yellow Enzyme family)